MEVLGPAAARALQRSGKVSRLSRLGELARPAVRDDRGLPVRFDRDVDHEFPRRLVCFRPTRGPWELRREMRADERAAVTARVAALEIALEPFADEEVAGVESAIAAMLGGFRSMRQTGENVEQTVAVIRAVLRHRRFPLWAIQQACMKIAARETKHVQYAPNDGEIVDVVEDVVRPYREAEAAARRLMEAVVLPNEERRKSDGSA